MQFKINGEHNQGWSQEASWPKHLITQPRHAGSDGSMSASGSAGPGFDPWGGGLVNFHLKIFNLGARRGWRCILSNR